MALYKTENGRVHHAGEIPPVDAVPSKRSASAAYAKIVAYLSYGQADDLGDEIQVVRDFLWSR